MYSQYKIKQSVKVITALIKQQKVHSMTESRTPDWDNIKTYEKLYQEILVNPDTSKFHHYFTEDCYININDKEYDADAFKQRMVWLKKNAKVKVEVVNFFTSKDGTKITDTHLSHSIDAEGIKRTFRVMQQSELENGRIKRFIDNTFMLSGSDSDYSITTNK